MNITKGAFTAKDYLLLCNWSKVKTPPHIAFQAKKLTFGGIHATQHLLEKALSFLAQG